MFHEFRERLSPGPGDRAERLRIPWRWCGMLIVAGLAMAAFDSQARGRRGGIAIVARLLSDTDQPAYPVVAFELDVRDARKKRRAGDRLATLFYVQDPPCRSALGQAERLAGFPEIGIPVVLAEHRGIDREQKVDRITCKGTTTAQRIADHAEVVDTYLRDELGPEHQTPVLLLGQGQGGEVATAIAAADERISHLILLGVGDLSDTEQDGADGVPTIPVFLGHGVRDQTVPVARARAARDTWMALGKKNLTYHEYERADHDFEDPDRGISHAPLVELDIVHWLADLGLIAPAERDKLARRVRANHQELFDDDS